jgi:hypothetical protein
MTKRSQGNSVGDWMQYLLFRHVGLTDMANQKGEELGIGHKWTQSTISDADGNDIAVELQTTASGKVLGGNRLDGTALTPQELNQAGGAIGSKLNIVGGSYVNDKTGEVGRLVSNEKTGKSYIQTDKGRKPMEGFRPQSSSGTAADQRAKLIREMNIKLQGKTLEEDMIIRRDYNKLLIGEGLTPLQPSEGGSMIAPQISDGQTTTTVPAAAPSAPAAAPGARPPAAATGQRPTATQIATGAEAAKTPVLVRREDEQSYIKYKNDDLLPKADAGNKLAGIRRDQISGPDGILNNPEIAGLLSGTGGQAREFQNLFRDVVGGSFDKVDDMSARIKQSGLDERTKQVLQIQLQRQREVTPLLIREVAPVGAITDFEQRMAKEAGIDVLRQGLYASLTNLTRSQFQSDMAAYKAVFAERNPELRTRAEFDRAWNAEKSRLDASYRQVYTDRAKYLGQYNRDGRNNNATIVAFRDHYPVPTFDPSTGQFRFGGYSRNAERPPLSTFERR